MGFRHGVARAGESRAWKRGPLLPHLHGCLDGLIYDALEALRHWRFEPGRRNGTPVAVFYDLEINPARNVPLARLVDLQGDFADTEQMLRQHRFIAARKAADRLWDNHAKFLPVDLHPVAVAFALRALATASGSEKDVAICLWQAAQTLGPALFDADLSAYGEAGALLARHRFWQEGIPAAQASIRPATAVRNDHPLITWDLGQRTTVHLAGWLDPAGHVRQPYVLSNPGDSALAAAVALDTVCAWRYRPATSAGRPVATTADLAVEFRPSLGKPPASTRTPAWSPDAQAAAELLH